MDPNEPASNVKPSFFRRVRRFLAWDGWIVRREIPEGFRLRRYVAWNAVGALCGLGLLAGAVALILSVLSKDPVELIFDSCNDGLALGWFFVEGVVAIASIWLFLHCGSRVVCMLRKNPETRTCGLFDAGRFFAGIVRPVILLWVLYIAATPVRPLGLHPAPPSMIPDWLKDENGDIVRPRVFPVSDKERPEWNYDGWSNLLERVGEPLPPQIRLAYEMRNNCSILPDKPLGMDANDRLRELLEMESRTNLVSLARLDKTSAEVQNWMAVCEKRLSRYEQCTGPQIWRFAVTNAAIRELNGALPDLPRDLNYVKSELLFCADSGAAEEFSNAVTHADVLRSAYMRFEYDLIPLLCARIIDSVKTTDVIRFGERTDVDVGVFSSMRKSFAETPRPLLSRATARACVAAFPPIPELLEKPFYEELGIVFWLAPNYARGGNPPVGFMRRFGAFAMLVSGCDFRGFQAEQENQRSYEAISIASLFDSEVDKDRELYLRHAEYDWMESPWILDFWRRGGIMRRLCRSLPMFGKFIRKALFSDAFPAVEDAALQLAQFRTEKGHDAESLEEAAAAIGAGVPDTGSAFFDLRYARIEPPEGAVPDSSAYALALVPKETSRIREAGCDCAWIVVRNPSFPGTRPSRIYARERPDGAVPSVLPGSNEHPLAVAEGAPASENARFTIPAALFGPDPEAIDAAERMMEEDGWQLK